MNNFYDKLDEFFQLTLQLIDTNELEEDYWSKSVENLLDKFVNLANRKPSSKRPLPLKRYFTILAKYRKILSELGEYSLYLQWISAGLNIQALQEKFLQGTKDLCLGKKGELYFSINKAANETQQNIIKVPNHYSTNSAQSNHSIQTPGYGNNQSSTILSELDKKMSLFNFRFITIFKNQSLENEFVTRLTCLSSKYGHPFTFSNIENPNAFVTDQIIVFVQDYYDARLFEDAKLNTIKKLDPKHPQFLLFLVHNEYSKPTGNSVNIGDRVLYSELLYYEKIQQEAKLEENAEKIMQSILAKWLERCKKST